MVVQLVKIEKDPGSYPINLYLYTLSVGKAYLSSKGLVAKSKKT